MQAHVRRQFGVERRREERTAPDQNRIAVDLGQYLDTLPDRFHLWRTNEDRSKRFVVFESQSGDHKVSFERGHLAAVTIAADRDRQLRQLHLIRAAVEDLFGEQDHSGAGPEHRHTVGDQRSQRVGHRIGAKKQRHSGGLATGKYQRINAIEILGKADRPSVRSQRFDRLDMTLECALKGENANRCCGHSVVTDDYQPRSAIRTSISSMPMPVIGVPRFRLTFTRTSGFM